jgi:hypothetical protein
VLAINPAIFWKLLYIYITKVLKTGQSKGNLRYKVLEILRGQTQEVIIIIFVYLLDFNNSSSFDLNSSVLLNNNFNFLSQVEGNRTKKTSLCPVALLPCALLLPIAQAHCTKKLSTEESRSAFKKQGVKGAGLRDPDFITINPNFRSYLAGFYEGAGCL